MCVNQNISKKLIQKKIKGGALYIAIMVGIIIGIMLTMFILLAKYNQRTVTVYSQLSQLNYNLKSALEIARSDYFTEDRNNKWYKNSLNDDSIKIKKINWGAYLLIVAETKNRHNYLAQSGLYGTPMSSDTGLVTSDKSRAIGLSGSIVFKANCYLPKAGIKPAFIEGQSYTGSSQNSSFIKIAPQQIQEINENFKKGISNQQSGVNLETDSSVSGVPIHFNQPFTHKTLLWETGTVHLSGLYLNNNIKIVCSSSIEIDSTCRLENILIVCEKVRFKEGFKGSVHVIASDSIIAEKKSEFTYPSSFVLSTEVNGGNSLKCIQFNDDCKFSGGIVAFTNSNITNETKVFVKLNATSEINGFVYSSDYIHVEGKLNANVFCNTLLLKTPSAVYENHMLACEIDPGKYAHLLAVPMVLNKSNKLINCKRL